MSMADNVVEVVERVKNLTVPWFSAAAQGQCEPEAVK